MDEPIRPRECTCPSYYATEDAALAEFCPVHGGYGERLVYVGRKPHLRYPADVERIVRVCAAHGFDISPTDAQMAWEDYSDSFAAGWLLLPDDDIELFLAVRRRCAAREAFDE